MKTAAETQKLDIISEIELIYRSKVSASQRPQITSSRRAYELALQNWDENKIEFIEQCKIMLLSQSHKVLGIYEMSSGGIAGTVVDIRLLFTAALKAAAVNVILIHNHPSGNTAPSDADRQITSKAVKAGQFLDVKILDHLIISSESYYSFADDGAL
ncbi:JAB domain-containing protein [Flavobacterium johnsoniae]|uniref:DNA repair protein RadC n=1 Tax=Flavobacterium johnsoniae (strain ATCC 17061 / DSM 2064 / JCM 8514 / BCRC 14874 / CCUG 350202 / NBRC 14942 / NCIMB 11054 / UW101) TaxID=376686 RepID=A5FDW5_FLAJ1|nr:JAB domain-containing protein [Flavobacterium johnsoniae]ABQ06596.1 DNA repair protein RadC [Flavobacterium johnsoniae UW101]OXE99830.1 DNA repair protein [Flavobacterium johnsoniae UW101]WQG82346.1 JAB domain-containing protein [Flavobacterium johnsoniae UW101]SHK80704.1 RadC-like JAB domain-containing protein [Flavobacterium johnsoniae]